MAFLTINIVQLFHMYNIRTNHSIFSSNPFKNKLLNIAFVAELAMILIVSLIPPIANIFNMTQLSIAQWLVIFGVSILIIPICETVKFFQRLKDKKTKQNIENNI